MYNLTEYSDSYSKTCGSLWQNYKDEPNDNLANSESFKFKVKITGAGSTGWLIWCSDSDTKYVRIILPLKYLSNFWKTLEMLLINCDVSLFPTWSSTCVITNFTGEGRSKTTDTKLFVPVVTLSIQDNVKLL